MSKITIEAAEKLTPEALTELIIQNVPPGEIRACLANLEKISPIEEPAPQVPQVPQVPQPKAPMSPPQAPKSPQAPPQAPKFKKTDNSDGPSDVPIIDYWRQQCSKNPILIISTDTRLPNKEGTYVIYYAKGKDGNFVKKSTKTEEFSSNTCQKLGNVENSDCAVFFDWVENKIVKLPSEKQNMKRVVMEYMEKNTDVFLDYCKNNPQYDQMLISLGIKNIQNISPIEVIDISPPIQVQQEDDLETLKMYSRELVPKTGILIFPQFTKDGKVRIYGPFLTPEKEIKWEKKDVSLNYIKTKVGGIKVAKIGTDRYNSYEKAFDNLDKSSAVYRNIRTVLIGLKRIGTEPPYPFLNDLSFGAVTAEKINNIILKDL